MPTTNIFRLKSWPLVAVVAVVLLLVSVACASAAPPPAAEPQIVEVTKIVEKPVEVTKVVTEQVEITKEVEVTKVVEVEKEVPVQPPPKPKEEIIFSDLNWTSAQVQNRIAQYIVEKGYGYPSDVVFGGTLPLFQGLRKGDTHVTMEIWLPNQSAAWEEALAEGEVVSVGKSLGNDWQSTFVIPAYLQDEFPDLDHIDDLKLEKFQKLFATPDSRGKARLVACVPGWSCEAVNDAQIEGYGLTDYLHVIKPGSQDAMFAEVTGAYEREEPWLGYMWGTGDPALLLDLVRLEETPYSDQCWYTTQACAFEDATILIAVTPDLPTRAPEVVDFLKKWDFNIDIYKGVVRWMGANPDASSEEAAVAWLKDNVAVWSKWTTPDVAKQVQEALDQGEPAEGWPNK